MRADPGRESPRRIVREVDGSETVVFDYGPERSAAILAVHGFRGTHYGLDPLARALAAKGLRVLVPDLPGCGESAPLRGRHDAAGYGDWLDALARGIGGPAVLLGHSFGSVIAAAAIARGAECRGAVLVNPILSQPLDGPRRIATAAARGYYRLAALLPERIGTMLLASRAVASLTGGMLASVRSPGLRRWIGAEHRRQAGAFHDRAVVLETFAAASGSTVPMFADGIDVPTLLLCGERDPLHPRPSPGIPSPGIPSPDDDAQALRVIPRRGHLLPYEAPGLLAECIGDWIRERLAG